MSSRRSFLTASLAVALALSAGARPSLAQEPASPTPIEVVVEGGYHPDRIVASAGQPIRLAFLRKEYKGCTLEVVFPTLGIRAKLPTGERVVVDLGPQPAGEIPFHCGMEMIHGVLVVEPKE